MSVEKIYSYAEKLETLRQKKSEALIVYESLVNELASSKSIIRGLIAKNFEQAGRETKKNAGIDTLELWVTSKFKTLVIKDRSVLEIYQDYIYLQEKEKTLSKIIESYGSDISSVQSEIKFNLPTQA